MEFDKSILRNLEKRPHQKEMKPFLIRKRVFLRMIIRGRERETEDREREREREYSKERRMNEAG